MQCRFKTPKARIFSRSNRSREACAVSHNCKTYTLVAMIRTFRHKGIEACFRVGTTAGIQAKHAARLRLQLSQLNHASGPNDMNAPPWKLHALKRKLSGHWSVWVNGNWRLTFTSEVGDAALVDYQDCH